MVESTTTNLSLGYTTSGYVDYWENSEYNCSGVPDDLMIFAGISLCISLCGLVGNGIVMWFLVFHTKQNPFAVYILNLTVADFSLLLLFLLLLLAALSFKAFCWAIFLPFYRALVLVAEFLCHFFDLSSMGLLSTISMEQNISVLFPIWYRCHRPKHLSGIICGVLWTLAGLFVSSMYLSFIFAESYQEIFASADIAITLTLSSLMLISDLSLCIRLRCGSRTRCRHNLHVAVLLNVIFFCFALGVSFSIENLPSLLSTHDLFPENCPVLMVLLSCSMDPIIYVLVGSCQQRRCHCSITLAFRRLFEEQAASPQRSHVPGEPVLDTPV